ncbi:MAG: DUF3048 domain-containing protein [Patescibacteria group bacterium]|jgi:hypothetical protein
MKIKSKKNYYFIIILLTAVVFMIAVVLFFIQTPPELITENIVPIKIEPCKNFRLIDGICVESGKEDIKPIAVMIENHFESWPQAGLASAQLVYEAVTEGAISRFLAIYTDYEKIEKIGPVRSARPYFIDWAEEYGALYLHCGGSVAALEQVKKSDSLDDVNEYYAGKYFWRDPGKPSPHNIFTSANFLNKYLQDYKIINYGNYQSWVFTDEASWDQRGNDYGYISFNYSPHSTYLVEWFYDRQDNIYYREHAGERHQDDTGKQIIAKNIVFQFVETKTLDSIGRKEMKTVGSGKALIFQNGKLIEGKWKKETQKDRTRFYDPAETEVAFVRGTTWIEVVPTGWQINY